MLTLLDPGRVVASLKGRVLIWPVCVIGFAVLLKPPAQGVIGAIIFATHISTSKSRSIRSRIVDELNETNKSVVPGVGLEPTRRVSIKGF